MRGFSLVETIFAASILSIVLMVLFNLYPSSLLAVKRAEHRLEATTLAQSVLEKKRTRPFGELNSLSPGQYYTADQDADLKALRPPQSPDGVQLEPEFQIFHIPDPDTDPGRLLGLRAKVKWKETSKRSQEVVQELWIVDIKK
jgi:uncharacterized protein (TIGR02598 family)